MGNWKVTAVKGGMLNSDETDRSVSEPCSSCLSSMRLCCSWSFDLNSMTLPEMVFGHSYIEIANESCGVLLRFDAKGALQQVGESSDIKVTMADEWAKRTFGNLSFHLMK